MHPAATTKAAKAANAAARRLVTSQHSTRHQKKQMALWTFVQGLLERAGWWKYVEKPTSVIYIYIILWVFMSHEKFRGSKMRLPVISDLKRFARQIQWQVMDIFVRSLRPPQKIWKSWHRVSAVQITSTIINPHLFGWSNPPYFKSFTGNPWVHENPAPQHPFF